MHNCTVERIIRSPTKECEIPNIEGADFLSFPPFFSLFFFWPTQRRSLLNDELHLL